MISTSSTMAQTGGDFFVYLSSRENKKEFVNNKFSSFTNIINPTINLNGNYTVALQNLIYKPIITSIKKDDSNFSVIFHITFKHTMTKIVKAFIPTKDINGWDIYETITNFNKDVVNYLTENQMMDPKQGSIFEYKPSYPHVKIKPLLLKKYNDLAMDIKMEYPIGTRKLLGLPYFEKTLEQTKEDGVYHPLANADSFYIYTDCIEPSIIGSQRIHLIDNPIQEDS